MYVFSPSWAVKQTLPYNIEMVFGHLHAHFA